MPPPPADAKFIFVGIGVSVYNNEMLSSNRLPLVNGISQLIVSPDEAAQKSDNAKQQGRQTRQRAAEEAAAAARAEENREAGRVGSSGLPTARRRRSGADRGDETPLTPSEQRKKSNALPQWPRVSPEEVEAIRRKERDDAREELRAKVGSVLEGSRARMQKQLQMSAELARIAPEKMRQAAGIQVAKAQEMPGMMMTTARKGVDLGSSVFRYIGAKLSKEEEERGAEKK